MIPDDVDEVSGGIAWFASPLAVRVGIGIGIAGVAGLGAAGNAIGYWANRD
ncbi:MAG: hypothetical protein ACK5LJ_03710 [Paracoccus sp. (in: a-proteobacteria)]